MQRQPELVIELDRESPRESQQGSQQESPREFRKKSEQASTGFWAKCKKFLKFLKTNSIAKLVVFYAVWVTIHYIAANLYPAMCAPATVMGFITSMFLTATPQCQALRWIITTGASNINNLLLLVAGWFLVQLTK